MSARRTRRGKRGRVTGKRRYLVPALVLPMVVAAGLLLWAVARGPVAPDFEVASARDGKVHLSDLQGRKVVLVFFPSSL